MPKSSIASLIVDWENLLANVTTSAPDVPGVDLYTAPLSQTLDAARTLNASVVVSRAAKQEGGKERRVLLQQGRKQAARLRAALKAHFGLDSESLVQFGSRPLRPRSRKAPETVPVPATPPPVTPPPTPEAGAGAAKPAAKAAS
jgi:hypothetical protein